jgi:hypothetical protein
MVYIVIALSFALAGGLVGRLKGSSFWLWFLISGAIPVLGLITALFYRYDTDEPRRHCPDCGHLCMLHDALCTRCGCELEFPDESEILEPVIPRR